TLLELAYEEFCLRRHNGEQLDPEEFCQRFPVCEASLRQMLSFDRAAGIDSIRLAEQPPPPAPEEWPTPGESLCGCVVQRELGKGHFARVYLATEESTGNRPVVLKLSRLATNEAC